MFLQYLPLFECVCVCVGESDIHTEHDVTGGKRDKLNGNLGRGASFLSSSHGVCAWEDWDPAQRESVRTLRGTALQKLFAPLNCWTNVIRALALMLMLLLLFTTFEELKCEAPAINITTSALNQMLFFAKTNKHNDVSISLLMTASCSNYSAMRCQGVAGSQREEYWEEGTNIWFTFIMLPEPRLQLNVNVSLCLLDVYVGNCLLTLSPQLYELMILWLRVVIAVEFLCLMGAREKKINYCDFSYYLHSTSSLF